RGLGRIRGGWHVGARGLRSARERGKQSKDTCKNQRAHRESSGLLLFPGSFDTWSICAAESGVTRGGIGLAQFGTDEREGFSRRADAAVVRIKSAFVD